MKKLLLSSLALSVITITDVKANTTSQEFAAIQKIASLCKTFNGSITEVTVVKDASSTDYTKIEGFANSAGLKVSTVDIADVASITTNIVVVASDVTPEDQEKIKLAFMGKPIITASTDLSCVESGKCLLGVDVGSSVKLLVNSQVYAASGLKFDSAFEFMVKQI